jgi:hypothetical protein
LGSVAGGGKFENGAVTGAFGYLFNHWLSSAYQRAQVLTARVLSTPAGTVAAEIAAAEVGLAYQMRAVAMKQAGFAADRMPLVLDEGFSHLASGLRGLGFNVRSFTEVFGEGARGTKDADILKFAEQIGAKVISADRGRDVGGGFGKNVIRMPGNGVSVETASRLIERAAPTARIPH